MNDPSASTAKDAICVFDIGGTWFRSGLLSSAGTLEGLQSVASVSYRNHPGRPVADLQSTLVAWLVGEARRMMAGAVGTKRAAISMGAALNAHTGTVLNSGPLWGPQCTQLDLRARLAEVAPDISWVVVNDVTAALAYFAARRRFLRDRRLSLITISTGIALRTYDRRRDEFPVDPLYGIQGEIGHIPIAFEFRGNPIHLDCDCGGRDHLNAFCSGRGLEAVVLHLAANWPDEFGSFVTSSSDGQAHLNTDQFAGKIAADDRSATELLSAVTLPVADAILRLLTVDPEIEHVILTGGVCRSLGERYRQQVLRHLARLGMYPVAAVDPDYFARRLVLETGEPHAGLVGAGLLAARTPSRLAAPEASIIRTMTATRSVSFPVVETVAMLDPGNNSLANCIDGPAGGVVIVDEAVEEIFGDRLRSYLTCRGLAPNFFVAPCSEQAKTPAMVERIVRWLDQAEIRRRTPVVAIGGGVLLDTVGMAAGQYRRGIPWVRVPTTLLAMVDASVGAKVGVNFGGHKSRLGLYYPPDAALIDRAFLATLGDRQLRNGMAEILKVALVLDPQLVDTIERTGPALLDDRFQSAEGGAMIRRAVLLMMDELEPNLWEANLDRRVDFGHSFSPGLELAEGADLLHGEAVAIDMVLSCAIAQGRGMIDQATWRRIVSMVAALGLPISHELCQPDFLWRTLQHTVLHRDGQQRLSLPVSAGRSVFCNDVTYAEVQRACRTVNELQKRHAHA